MSLAILLYLGSSRVPLNDELTCIHLSNEHLSSVHSVVGAVPCARASVVNKNAHGSCPHGASGP